MNLKDYSLVDFIKWMTADGIQRFSLKYDEESERITCSDDRLEDLGSLLEHDARDFDRHEGLFFALGPHGHLFGAFIHNTRRGQGAGGVRRWRYDNMESFMRDGLRLSKGMTRKNALAGLWWGGGKGLIASGADMKVLSAEERADVYTAFGEFITSLDGCYITAEDVGTSPEDMQNIYSATRFCTCIPPQLGGSGNPSLATARGVVAAMDAALEFIGLGGIEGKVIAMQGAGNVAQYMISLLLDGGAKSIKATDINAETVASVRSKFSDNPVIVEQTEISDHSILAEPCDVLAPCATGGILNPLSIPKIRASVICGAANNQLEDANRDDQALLDRGLIYVPDFLANRMGIVNCSNEQYGRVEEDPAIEKHLDPQWQKSVQRTTLAVLKKSAELGRPTAAIAIERADQLAAEVHPIFGHRGKQIIDSVN